MALQVAVYKRSLLVSNEKKQCKEQVKEATTYEKLQSEAMDLKTKRVLPMRACWAEAGIFVTTSSRAQASVRSVPNREEAGVRCARDGEACEEAAGRGGELQGRGQGCRQEVQG
eukprot:1089939-Rhodomonas_salina.4